MVLLPSFVRIVGASCASVVTACVLWSGGGGGDGNSLVELSHAIDMYSVPVTVTVSETETDRTLVDVGRNIAVGRNSLQPCPYESNCVSSNYLEPPNRYVSPLTTFRDRDTAFARAIRDLKDAEAVSVSTTSTSSTSSSGIKVIEILPRQYYLHATVPGTSVGSLDDVEILFGDAEHEGIVHIRCQARKTLLPPPPFCLQKNCINGNMDQRTRMERIAKTLGLPAADRERMASSAKWTPIFFNSDRVPGFEDEL